MNDLEGKIKYHFKDKGLLEAALMHSSYARENGSQVNNERLEFLGDAFFDAIIGEELFRKYTDKEEGFLSKMRAALVCEDSLVKQAKRIGIGDKIKLGRGEEKTGGRERKSILADAMEAVIGAVFLDGGYDAAKGMVLTLFSEEIKNVKNGRLPLKDYKSALQELLQSEGISAGDVRYVDVAESGPDHNKVFHVRLEIDGNAVAEGSGKSKKQAQQMCAEQALRRRENAI